MKKWMAISLAMAMSTTLAVAQPAFDFEMAAQALGVTAEQVQDALGDPSAGAPDFEAAGEILGVSSETLMAALGIEAGPEVDPYTVTLNGVDFEITYEVFDWAALPEDVIIERLPKQSFEGHDYEVIYLENGNLNWYQAAWLAQDAGGYLASITSAEENAFVFDLINDTKFFWFFEEDGGHYGISIGPFLGGYQPEGSPEPDGGWQWLSGEDLGYTNWAQNLDDGVIDKDPRDNTQPNDSGDVGQPIMGFGELNQPVPTWGDYMENVGTYGSNRLPGRSYGFIIEYE